jgi:hypothetical protein
LSLLIVGQPYARHGRRGSGVMAEHRPSPASSRRAALTNRLVMSYLER